ncbi:MAG: DEAD/DEAH box helicase [Planctomycetes bacterium]|jgi:SNF2 family DNA or RNA helicase|nr:DEAD/DEAH box helicase [Planctomycetota bacterium]
MPIDALPGGCTRSPGAGERWAAAILQQAGGVSINLVQASYVFLLDPWWNPAAEMQAIDRAHRMGQQRTVHAYRLVCKGTVEEQVLELQAKKKALSDAILGGDGALLQELQRSDLEQLLK